MYKSYALWETYDWIISFIYLWLRYQYPKPSLPSQMAVTRLSCRICRPWSLATNRIFCRCCNRRCAVDLDSNRRCCVAVTVCLLMPHSLGLATMFAAKMDWRCVSLTCPYWDWLVEYYCWCRRGGVREFSNSNYLEHVECSWFWLRCLAIWWPSYSDGCAFHSMMWRRILPATQCPLCYSLHVNADAWVNSIESPGDDLCSNWLCCFDSCRRNRVLYRNCYDLSWLWTNWWCSIAWDSANCRRIVWTDSVHLLDYSNPSHSCNRRLDAHSTNPVYSDLSYCLDCRSIYFRRCCLDCCCSAICCVAQWHCCRWHFYLCEMCLCLLVPVWPSISCQSLSLGGN